ncbi:MAG TPA: RND transporter, partial [Burkholderiaceae bacterium]
MSTLSKRSVLALAAVLLTGCVAGPDFRSPEPPRVGSYTGADPRRLAQQAFVPEPLHAGWWKDFRVPAVNDLV